MRTLNIIIIFLLLALGMTRVVAHDLGTFGQTFKIREVDLRTRIIKDGQAVNWTKIGLKMTRSARAYVSNLPPNELVSTQHNYTYYVDPSIALNRDFSYRGQVFYHKGTFVNPLEYVRPHSDMLFFDGRDQQQVAFALRALARNKKGIMLVMTAGNPVTLAKRIHRPVYYGFKRLTQRFHITHVPSLLGVGGGGHYYDLSIMNFAKPYRADLVGLCMHGCSDHHITQYLRAHPVEPPVKAISSVNQHNIPAMPAIPIAAGGLLFAYGRQAKAKRKQTKKRLVALFLAALLLMPSATLFADSATCHGRFLNPITDINWNMVFPITIAGVPISIGAGSGQSPLVYTSPLCLCPGRIAGIPTPGIEVTFHEPLYIEEIAKDPGCMATIGGIPLMPGYEEEATDLKEDSNSTSRWQVHWYEYPVFAILKLFQDLTCLQGGGFALAYMTELDPTWQNDEWGAVFSPQAIIFANPIAQAACIPDSVSSSFQQPLDALFWCAGSWGGIYPYTGNANASAGRFQSAEQVGAKMIARLSGTGFLMDSVGSWAMCSPLPSPIWVKSQFSIDPVYPMVRRGPGMSIGSIPTLWMAAPPQSYPTFENISQVVFQEQQCCIHV